MSNTYKVEVICAATGEVVKTLEAPHRAHCGSAGAWHQHQHGPEQLLHRDRATEGHQMTTTPTSGAADLPEALINIAREIEALKRDCGMDPESAIAIQNGRYMAISYKVRALATGQATAAQSVACAALPDEGEPWRGHKFKEVQRGCWRCDCGKTIKEVTSDQSTPASGGNYPVMPKRYTVDDDGEELFTAEKMRAFADATHTLRASHGQAPAPAQPDKPIACSYGDNGYACCEGGPCQADVHNDKLAEQQAPATAQAADSVPAPAPPPECETEAEKRAFAFGWFKALESERMKAESVQEDAARYRWLRRWKGQEHEPPFTVQHELDGTLWGGDLDAAIDAAMNKGGV